MKLIYPLLLLLLLTQVYGLGIAPAQRNIFFEPGKSVTQTFRIINSEHKDMTVAVTPRDEMAKYIELEENIFRLKSTDYEKTVTYTLNLPEEMNPGENIGELFVVELFEGQNLSDVVVKTNLGVIHRFVVTVPYPGEYLQGILYVPDIAPGEKTVFTVSLSSLGNMPLNSIYGDIVITSPHGDEVARVKTGTVNLQKGEKGKLEAEWLASAKPGSYHIKAVIYYGAKSLLLEKDFDVGSQIVSIKDIQVVKFKLGTVAKFDLFLDNQWNRDIRDIYLDAEIRDTDYNLVGEYTTERSNILASSDRKFTIYWDTGNIEANEYMITVRTHYLDKTSEKIFNLIVRSNEIVILNPGVTGQVTRGNEGSGISNSFLIVIIIILATASYGLFTKLVKKPLKHIQNHPDLKQYIKSKLKAGYAKQVITDALLAKGWTEETIELEMLKAEDELALEKVNS